MYKRNCDIRKAIKEANIPTWLVAEVIGVHENTFYRSLRKPLTQEEKNKVLEAIKQIKGEHM